MIFSALALIVMVASPAPTLTLHAPTATLQVEVARTEAQRERGLMDRTSLSAHHGMLFVFDREASVTFWMKDTLVPLDMVFVNGYGIVDGVYERVPVVPAGVPDDKIPRESGTAKYVIELPAGEAARDGLVSGAAIPELGPRASKRSRRRA